MTRMAPQAWMLDPATQAVIAALAAGGVEVRFVGGCVRDALLDQPIGDIDIATPATPEQVTVSLVETAKTAKAKGGVLFSEMPPR